MRGGRRPGRPFAAVALLCAAAITGGCAGDAEKPVSGAQGAAAQRAAHRRASSHAPKAKHSATSITPTATPARTALATGRPADARILSSVDWRSFAELAVGLGGRAGLAVSGTGKGQPVEHLGDLDSAVAWSTSKVPLAMAVIDRFGARAYRSDLTAAITASDNAAALRLWNDLGGGATAGAAVDAQLRRTGDEQTVTQYRTVRSPYTPFGQTDWSLTRQARFVAGMACSDAGWRVLRLMDQVIPSERWGLGAAGVPASFKGGWGPGWQPGTPGSYLDRQMGLLVIHHKALAVAIAAVPADGNHETGARELTRIASWVAAHANVRGLHTNMQC